MKLKIKGLLLTLLLVMSMAIPAVAEEIPVPFAFAQPTFTVNVGKKISIAPTVPAGQTIVKWKVSKKNIVKLNKNGKIKGLKSGKVKITAISSAGQKITCKVKVTAKKSSKKTTKSSKKKKSSSSSGGGTVYWTPSGEVYHYSSGCSTLSRSRTILSGTIAESGKSRGCKVCG